MRRTGFVAAGLLTACAILTVGAAGASAALPELGRCLPAESQPHGKGVIHEGQYSNPSCTHMSARHRGKYEWAPGPGSKPKFVGFAVEPEPTLQTTTGAKVECSSMVFDGGEYTGPTTAKVSKVLFSGCTSEGVPCQTTVALHEGEIEGNEFTMELGKIEPPAFKKSATAGWDLKKAGSGEAFTYECGKLPELRSDQDVGGSVIAPLSSSKEYDVNHMSPDAFLLYKAVEGKQLPEAFTGGEKDTLLNKTTTESLSYSEAQVGLTTDLQLEGTVEEKEVEPEENKEPLEIKTIA
jgi:hypothetical protein